MKDKIKKTIETYNKYAKIYADRTFELVLQFQQNEFLSLLNGKKILDVGCGPGRDAKYFSEEGYEVLGIDLSEGMLEEAKKRAEKAKFQKMDVLDMNFKEGSFDGAWIAGTITNLEKEDAKKLLKDCKRILKEKGIIFVSVKEGEGEGMEKRGSMPEGERLFSYYTKQEVINLMESVGLKVLKATVAEEIDRNWVEVFATVSSK